MQIVHICRSYFDNFEESEGYFRTLQENKGLFCEVIFTKITTSENQGITMAGKKHKTKLGVISTSRGFI